jgi:L-threonylcarbamoyladenylate synthase
VSDPRQECTPIALDEIGVRHLRACLRAGGVAVLPTDTVYGLACDPQQERAVRRLYELKGRPPMQPAAVMFFALPAALEALPELAVRERAALEALLPGPLTVLLPNRKDRYPLACVTGAAASAADAVRSAEARASGPGDRTSRPGVETSRPGVETSGPGALGLRVPLLPEPLMALGMLERPVMQSSANLSGGPEARRLREVPAVVLDGADLVLDGGELPGVASTVLDLRDYETEGRWRIVREGPLGEAELRGVLASC